MKKQRREESEKRREENRTEEKRREEERRSEKRKSQKTQDAGARKGSKVAIYCVFPMICGSRGSKSVRSTFPSQNVQNTPYSEHFWKLRMLGALLEVAMSKKCTPLWREAHLQVKMHNTPCSDHFWKLTCRKSARRCGAKHISKSNC